MIRKLLVTLLAAAISVVSSGRTISGTLYYQGGPSTAGPYQTVMIWDTTHTWSTTVQTDYDGTYSVVIPTSVPTTAPANLITVAVFDAPPSAKTVVVNTGNPVADFDIGYGFSPISAMEGFLHFSSNPTGMLANQGAARYYLVRKYYDPVVADTILTALDSFDVTHAGGFFSRPYTVRPRGFLLIKAALLPGNPEYANYLPTYSGAKGALRPVNVYPLRLDAFIKSFTTEIIMTRAVNPGGPGFIGGQISLGANKTAGVGDPVPNRSIMLTTSAGTPVAHTVSDASGKFQFANIAYGSYQLFGDAFDRANPVLNVTISPAKPRVANVVFEENDKRFAGHVDNVGVNAIGGEAEISLYPNPAQERCTVVFPAGASGTLLLSDMLGRTLRSVPVSKQREILLDLSGLASAVYQLHFISGDGATRRTLLLTRE